MSGIPMRGYQTVFRSGPEDRVTEWINERVQAITLCRYFARYMESTLEHWRFIPPAAAFFTSLVQYQNLHARAKQERFGMSSEREQEDTRSRCRTDPSCSWLSN